MEPLPTLTPLGLLNFAEFCRHKRLTHQKGFSPPVNWRLVELLNAALMTNKHAAGLSNQLNRTWELRGRTEGGAVSSRQTVKVSISH